MIDDLKIALSNNIVEIDFIKVDGSNRKIKATRDVKRFTFTPKKTNVQKIQKNDILSVWDLENNGWRSIKIDNIVTWKVMD